MEKVIDDITLNEIKLYPSPKYKKSMPTFLSKEQVERIVEKVIEVFVFDDNLFCFVVLCGVN